MRQLRISESITKRDILLNKYLSEIDKYPLLSIAEEIQLGERSLKGDMKARNQLINSNLRFVVSVAKQYQNQGMSLIDLINEGNIGLTKASERFDPSRGFKFISYAVWRIRQSITTSIYYDSSAIRKSIPTIQALNAIFKMKNRFMQQHYRDATNEELAILLEMKQIEVDKFLMDDVKVQSYDVSLTDEVDSLSLVDIFSSGDMSDSDLNLHSIQDSIKKALNLLPLQQKQVISMLYGFNESGICYSPNQIATMLSIAPYTVLKLEKLAKESLKKILGDRGIDENFLQIFD